MSQGKLWTRVASVAAASLFAAAPVSAQSSLNVSGQIDVGFRYYLDDGLLAGQSDEGIHPFAGLTLEANAPLGQGELVFKYHGLLDEKGGRVFSNVEKAYYTQTFDTWDLLVGWNVENWGVAESRSIVNVLNANDQTDTINGGELIGTPMINANFYTDVGTFSGYVLLGFEQGILPDRSARGRSIWGTADNRAVWEKSRNNPDFALRWSNNYSLGGGGALDVSASIFAGANRQAMSLPGCANAFGTITEAVCRGINQGVVAAYESGFPAGAGNTNAFWNFVAANANDPIISAISAIPAIGFFPYYQDIKQVGVTTVYSQGDLQLRFEGIYREAAGEKFAAAVIGGDYTWNNLGDGDDSLTLAVEYLWDDRSLRQPTAIFENDVFLGANYMWGGTRDSRMKLGVFHDLDSQARFYTATFSTRVNDRLRAEVNVSHATTKGYNDPLSFIAKDTFFELKLSTFF